MFGFKSISVSKILSSIINKVADAPAYFLMKLSGESVPGNTNTAIFDSSQSAANITNNGSVSQTSFSPFAQNWSTQFSGSSSYVSFPNNVAYNLNGDFTIELWFNASTLGTSAYTFISNYVSTTVGWNLQFRGDSGNVFRFSYGTTAVVNSSRQKLVPGTWYHLTATRSGPTVRLFLNGTQIGVNSATTAFTSTTSLVVGSLTTAQQYFPGHISNVRVVNGSALYTANFTPSTVALTAVPNTCLLTCQNANICDNSAFNAVATTAANASTTTFNPFGNSEITSTPTNSIAFDGSSFLEVTRDVAQFGTNNFTIEAWIYLNDLSETAIFSRAWSGSNFFFAGGANGNMDWWIGHPGANWGRVTTTTAPIQVKKWTHIAFTRNSNTFTIWVDGVSAASNTLNVGSLDSSDTTPFRIGRYPFSGSPWNGNISNFRIINGTCLYTEAFTTPTSNLTAITGTSLLVGSGNIIADLSTNARVITLSGTPRVSAASPFSLTSTRKTTAIPSNYSYSFNGSSYFSVSRDCVQFGTGNFTMEAWIYPTSTAEMNIFSRNWSGSNFLLCGVSSGTISFWAGHPTAGYVSITSANTAIKINQWQHIALTRSGTAVNIWVNGVSVASATSSVNMTSADTTPLTIGRYPFSGIPFSGYISNVRIVNGYSVYTTAFTPPTSKLTVLPGTTLLTCQSSTVVDEGPSALAITTTGTITPTLADYSYGNSYSLQFSGSGQYLSSPSNSAFAFGTGDFTIECWINSTDVGVSQRGFLQTSTTAGGLAPSYTTGVVLAQGMNTSGGNLDGGLVVNVAGTNIGSNTAVLSTNTWYHVAVTRQAGMVRLFLNGALNASGTATGNCAGTNLAIGGYYNTSYLFAGRISNLRVITGRALYTATFIAPTVPLLPVEGTEVLTCQSNRPLDNSTNNFTFATTGTPAVSTVSPFTSVSTATFPSSTLFGGSASFTGNTSLQIPATSSISGTSDFTVDYWIYPTAFGSGYTVLFANDTSGGLSMSINSTGTVAFGRSLVATDGTTSNSVNFGCWNHIAICRAGGTLRMFINGRQGYSAANSTNFTSGIVRIGSDGGGSTLFYNGLMANFRMQRTALYNGPFTLPTSPVIKETINSNTAALLTFNSFGIIDTVGVQQSLVNTGATVISNIEKKNGQASLYFNGTNSYLMASSPGQQYLFNNDVTVEAWIYPTSSNLSSRTERIISFIFGSTAQAVSLYFNGLTFSLWTSTASDNGANRITTTAVVPNTWTHVALVKKDDTFTLLINGVSIGTSNTSILPTAANPIVYVGTFNGTTASDNFTGFIDDLKIFAYAKYLPVSTYDPLFKDTTLLIAPPTTPGTFQTDESGFNRGFGANSGTSSGLTPYNYGGKAINEGYYSGFFSSANNVDLNMLVSSANSAFQFPGDFTVECWFNSTVFLAQASVSLLSIYSGPITNLGFSINTGFPRLIIDNVNTDFSTNILSNTWNHIAFVRSGSTIKVYVNGVADQVTSTTSSILGGTTGTLSIRDANFSGYISNLRIVKGVSVYTSDFTPSTVPLTSISGTSLLTFQNVSFVDNSPYRHELTPSGTGLTTTNVAANIPFTFIPPYFPNNDYGSVRFSGNTNVTIGSATTDLNVLGSDFAIECWVNPVVINTAGNNYIIAQDNGGTSQNFYLRYLASGAVQFVGFISSSRTGAVTLTSTKKVSVGSWYHIAVTHVKSTNTTRLFLNGKLEASSTTALWEGAAVQTYIANLSSGASSTWTFNAYLADVRLVKGSAVYTSDFTPPTEPLASIPGTLLLTYRRNKVNNSLDVVDRSYNNANVTQVGNPRNGSFSPFSPNWSTQFNGSSDYLTLPAGHLDFIHQGVNSWTFECWANSNLSTAQALLSTTGSTAQTGFCIYLNSGATGNVVLAINRSDTGNAYTASTPAGVLQNSWNHIAITFNGTSKEVKIFVNGALQNVTTNGTAVFGQGTATYSPNIGRFNTASVGPGGYFSGYISNLRIVKDAILYSSSFTPSLTPLSNISGTKVLVCGSRKHEDRSSDAVSVIPASTVKVSPFNPFRRSTGYNQINSGGSVYLNGTGDYLTCSYDNKAAQNFGTGNFTIEAWVYFGTVSLSEQVICGLYGHTANRRSWCLYVNQDNLSIATSSNGSTINSASSNTSPLKPGMWHHLAFVRSGNTLTGYVDGNAVVTNSVSGSLYENNTDPISVGALGPTYTSLLNSSYISGLRVVKGTALYTSNFTLPTTPSSVIEGTVLLLNTTENSVFDSTGNFTIETVGNSRTIMTTIAKFANGSIFFDGTGDYLGLTSSPIAPVGDFTIESWVYPTTGNTSRPVFYLLGGTTGFAGVKLSLSDTSLTMQSSANGTTFAVSSGTIASGLIAVNTWVHIAVVRSGNAGTVYVNGASVYSFTWPDILMTGAVNLIGGGQTGSTTYSTMFGYLSDVRITRAARYTAAFTPPLTLLPQSSGTPISFTPE